VLEWIIQVDTAVFVFFNATIANGVFDVIFPIITDRENNLIFLAVVGVFYLRAEKKKALIGIGLALLTVAISDPLCVRVLKPLVGRLRPCHPEFYVEGARFLRGMKGTLSFPSAHAMNWFAQATLFAMLYPKRTAWFFTLASAVAFSRVYVGVHYPLDILAGAWFGVGVGGGVYYGYKAIERRLVTHRRRAAEPPSGKVSTATVLDEGRAIDGS
jgi:undecaprenyl-diphosphatase